MNTETIRLEPSRFSRIHFSSSPKINDAPTRTFLLSPYDTPEAVIVSDDEHSYNLAIRYLFESSTEPILEQIGQTGVTLKIDPSTGRIYGLSLAKSSAHGKRLTELLQKLAEEVEIPQRKFIEGGQERGRQFRRAVLPILLQETALGLSRRQDSL